MATEAISPSSLHGADDADRSRQWRALARTATAVAVLTSPVVFTWFYLHQQLDFRYALLLTVIEVAAFRGLVDLLFRRFIETPSLFGVESEALREADIVARRRVSFWRTIWKLVRFVVVVVTLIWLVLVFFGQGLTWVETAQGLLGPARRTCSSPSSLGTLITLPLFFLFNFLIFMGPMLLMGISQIRGYQPGDAEWGVKLEHVRGQAEAKEEIRRIVTLWQSGERFERSGGKRERGLLFLGAPGTGKTMLAKAIATGFNSPFVTIPGSGFAQTFVGLDSILVRYLARKAKRLARKWGGQCIVFIDEIDAVGMRRSALGGSATPSAVYAEPTFEQSGDLVLETRAWRDKQFELRAPERRQPNRFVQFVNQAVPGRRRDVRRRWRHGAQPAARRDGRARQPAARQADRHEHDQHAARRDVRRAAAGCAGTRSACRRRGPATSRSTSSAPRTSRSSSSIRLSRAPDGWAGTSGSARRRSRTARTSSTSTSAASRTTRISTVPSAATSSRG